MQSGPGHAQGDQAADEVIYHAGFGPCRVTSYFTLRIYRNLAKKFCDSQGDDLQGFSRDEIHLDAVLRNLGIIGEAVKNVSEETRQKYPKVKWRKIAGFRDIVTHEYFGVNEETVWDIIKNEIPRFVGSRKKPCLGNSNSCFRSTLSICISQKFQGVMAAFRS